MPDTLESVARPSWKQEGDPPEPITTRGGDVRAYDRRQERHVYGPHPFEEPSDALLQNGLWRVWPGPRNFPPFLHVEAFRSGEWHHAGVLSFERDLDDELLGARLLRMTPDIGVLALNITGVGEVLVTLRRGERMDRIQHGGNRLPQASVARYVRWRGIPPHERPDSIATGTGKFGTGISDYVKWPWPSRLNGDWGFGFWWLPDSANTAQADSGLLSIVDTSGSEVGKVEWLADTDRIRFELGADAIEITGLTFSANDPVFVSPTFSESDGMGLTVDDGSGVEHASDDTATTEPADLDRLYWGLVYGGNTWGDETTWGDDDEVWGGAVISHGVVDNLQGFVGRLTEAERASLAGASSGLDGLPSPLSRLVFYVPADVEPVPLASSLSSGRRNEVDSGGSRLAHDGLTKALGVLDSEVVETAGLSVGQNVTVLDMGAFLASTDTNDNLSDHHEQFSTDQEQETRAR